MEAEVDPTWSINNSESINSLLRINVLFDFVEKMIVKYSIGGTANSFISHNNVEENKNDDSTDMF